jgi:general secretion pathway protein H
MERRQSGFTLLEILLVMTIAALMLALAPPLLSAAMPGVQLKGTTREVAALLRQARSRAVTQGRDVALAIDLQRREARIEGTSQHAELPERLDVTLVSAQSELDDPDHGRIRFYPDGTSTGGRVTLHYGHSGYQVDVDWLTGRIQVAAAP